MIERLDDSLLIFHTIFIDTVTGHCRIMPGMGTKSLSLTEEQIDNIKKMPNAGYFPHGDYMAYCTVLDKRYRIVFPNLKAVRDALDRYYQEGIEGLVFSARFLDHYANFIAARKGRLIDQLRLELAVYVHDFRHLNEKIASASERILSEEFKTKNLLKETARNILSASRIMTLKMDFSKYLYSEVVPKTTKDIVLAKLADDTTKLLEDIVAEKGLYVSNGLWFESVTTSLYLELCLYLILENACTYAPPHSRIYIRNASVLEIIGRPQVDKRQYHIVVSSEGVKIDPKIDILDQGKRCSAAIEVNPEGEGFGLFIANRIAAEQLNGGINWVQAEKESTNYPGYYFTTFHISGS